MNRYFWLFGLLTLCLLACRTESDADKLYASLKPGQARVSIQLDGQDFYPSQSIFGGQVDVFNSFLRLNLSDQFESNIIASFSGDDWYKQKPVKRQVFIDNQVSASVMIGRLTDKVKRRGEGYLMTDGLITVETMSDAKLVMRLTGKVGKYEYQRMPEKWNELKGLIVIRNPTYRFRDVTKKDVYF
jgi:hypothetical protein